ncbi:MAG: hypothetical protein A3J54_03145 [Candidatus Ryanbacteria bacterium RIFCSPHIGHO2_02_FULL_45_13b]|uniref:Uncharacterized protein n=1 Tax=Candidatus Ryanbacteria bacterium RIFCSPHIGHO2_02_FULL_45_13b TaxID=1802117 RepID=A0A1G2G439_9BACT|nr:MAG: hypothetical protein A3J54_03145 [Candidatus Ryanbacteria bacterium RIFCSPHIGHO2_02_FULL_45_13b]
MNVFTDLFTLLAIFLTGAFGCLTLSLITLGIVRRQKAKDMERIYYTVIFVSIVFAWGTVAISATTLWVVIKILSR